MFVLNKFQHVYRIVSNHVKWQELIWLCHFVSLEYLRNNFNMLRNLRQVWNFENFENWVFWAFWTFWTFYSEHFEYFEHFEHFEFLALGAFASGLGLDAFESCFCLENPHSNFLWTRLLYSVENPDRLKSSDAGQFKTKRLCIIRDLLKLQARPLTKSFGK